LPKLKDLAYEDKLNRSVSEWFEKKRKDTYVKIDPEYQGCTMLKMWVGNNPTAQAK
jgi:peptidyl-prolyl cis-trans isomerase SurA